MHDLLQIAFDWSDFHLHRFVIRGKEYGVSRMGCTTFTTDARKVLLSQFGLSLTLKVTKEFETFSGMLINARYYGRSVTAEQILRGRVPPARNAQSLINALSRY